MQATNMSSQKPTNPEMKSPSGRPVGGTEHSWCKAIPGGTGIATLAVLTSKPPNTSLLDHSLQKLQHSHPILRSRLQYNSNSSTPTFSFTTSPTPLVRVKKFDLISTCQILTNPKERETISPLLALLEHELNLNSWVNFEVYNDLFFATIYEVPGLKWVLVLRLHVLACDRTTAVSLLKELLGLMGEEGKGNNDNVEMENGFKGKVCLAIEDLIPNGMAKKALWVRGVDLLGYSVNSLRLTNLRFMDSKSPRSSQVVRLQLDQKETERIISGCKTRGIKLCGALAGAGLIAAHCSNNRIDKQRKYGVMTLTDCRPNLKPYLSNHHFGKPASWASQYTIIYLNGFV